MKATTQDLAQLFQVDKAIAYGLVTFLKAKGLVDEVGTRKVEGARGKGATLYEFDPSQVGKDLVDLFDSIGG